MKQPVEYLNNDTTPCLKCENHAILIARTDYYCKDCFIRFVRGKQRKQMVSEQYRAKFGIQAEKYGIQKVLLAFSGGITSMVLLDILSDLLLEQQKTHKGVTGFNLIIVNIDEFEIFLLNKKIQDIIPNLIQKYNGISIEFKVLSLDSFINEESLYKISLNDEFKSFFKEYNQDITILDILNQTINKSSAEDLLNIIYKNLLLEVAYVENCQTIVLGHSMTRIANEIVALTVKGRGSEIHESIKDHTEIYKNHEIKIMYPLRDVLYAEIIEYGKLADLYQFTIESTIKKSKISKNLTIRDLISNYFTQLTETGYASTASTVVKTGEKLGKSKEKKLGNCKVCNEEIYKNPSTWLKTITVNEPASIETEEELEYNKLYKESTQEEELKLGNPLELCYGCIITLGGFKQTDSGLLWPLKSEEKQLNYIYENDEVEKQHILDEYTL
ncbi:unnamed protein product [Candida verbasci]|uniref:Cytoplasmic tRNA 2-thiolation protein 2 n=1 Tax=Candida verbasci TaxID=1227364 RepID=A0A9W4TUS1_9ASCO|nr:unnamed protein product [Candida verbasci]